LEGECIARSLIRITILTLSQAQWVPQLTKKTDEYKNEVLPRYLNVIAHHYSENGGPYLLGEKITYADFAVYQSLDNNKRIGLLPVCLGSRLSSRFMRSGTDHVQATLPASIEKFKQAFEARPNIAAYIKENA
jgi:glutathione S-transferase